MKSFPGDKRYGADRRGKPTPLLSRYAITGGRRKAARRKHDARKHIFVDVYDTRLFVAIFALLVMNVLDGFLTLLLIEGNIVSEANPFMAFWLDYGHAPFFWIKYTIMAVSALIFCVFKNFIFSNVALGGSILIYASVLVYELRIVFEHYPRLFPQ